MKNARIEIIAAQMTAVLQEDAKNLQAALTRLNDLRASLLKRDPASLEDLLAVIKSQQDAYAINESRRNELRAQAAIELGCPIQEMNISRLIPHIGQRTSTRLLAAKAQIQELTAKLRTEYFATASLLSECARFNRQLVNALLGGKSQVTTYNCRGNHSQQLKSAMVNLQL